jgi:VWFA-related protein
MFHTSVIRVYGRFSKFFPALISLLLGVCLVVAEAAPACAQDQSAPPADDSSQGQNQNQKAPPPPAAGGPDNEVGPYAIPKKAPEPPPPPKETPKKIAGMPDYSIQVNVPLVNVDVMVTTKDGQFIPGLKQNNFKVYEDGVEQKISNFNVTQAPITAVLLVEFASTNYYFMVDALNAAYTFASTLKKNDWVAVASYDMKPHILVDFTQDKQAVMGGLNQLRMPGFAETNLFDALYDTLDRLEGVDGHKYIILISTGVDTFSKLNLDQILKKVRSTHDVTIFPVSIGWMLRNYFESRGSAAPHGMGIPISNMDYLQADNEMNTFAKLTGGKAYFPRFQGELPEVFQSITGDIRNQYQIAYHPTNPKLDGTYRKLKVEVVAPDGGALKVRNQKGKDVKYQIIARDGYTAKHTVD